MSGNLKYISIDAPNDIVGHVWEHSPYGAERTYYQGVENQCATVTVGALQFAVGYDPSEDGILWSINADTFGDCTQFDQLYMGGWAPGDRDTAEREIATVISVLHGHIEEQEFLSTQV